MSSEMWKTLGRYSAIGIELAAIVIISVYLGNRVDHWLSIRPWGSLFFIAVAIGASVKMFLRIIRQYRKELQAEQDDQ